MEAACTAAEVGCTTFLLEKKPYLGGLAAEISKIPDKKRLADFPNYMIHRTNNLKNLFAFTNTDANVDFIKNLKPNIIVNATGSSPLLPPIPGLHENIDKEGGKVASILTMINHVYMMPIIGNGIDPVSKVDMGTLMKKYGVHQMPNTALKEVRPDNFLVEADGELKELPFDYGFVCLGMKAENPVLQQVKNAFEDDQNIEIVNIGDSVRARRIIEGTEEGRNILNTLEKRGYL